MKEKVCNLDNKSLREIPLNKFIFGIEFNSDVIHRMIRYQLAKRRSGNHKTKNISEISGTTKKPFKQKGTGRARQGSKRSPQMRGGAVIFGPVVRSHAHKLPKRIRNLALRVAISKKLKDGKLKIIENFKISKNKTSFFKKKLEILNINSALFVDGKVVDGNFLLASSNVPKIDVLPIAGINVYDIFKRDFLVLSSNAIDCLEKRFLNE